MRVPRKSIRNEEVRALDVQILAISVDPPDKDQWVEEKLKAPYAIPSHSIRTLTELYGTRSPEYHNRESCSINTPTTLALIDGTGAIRWIRQATNFS